MNIERAWAQHYTGKGVLIGIVDPGGIDKSNTEFNYVGFMAYSVFMYG